ncbi:YaaA family protein, partial [Candidatus Saccharibacteria bacterium]|nr:YaaA family protein [Candidatus Saccharibacteria bacterium]
MLIIIHSSKTMRPPVIEMAAGLTTPTLIQQARRMSQQLQIMSQTDIKKLMQVSDTLAGTTQQLLRDWTDAPSQQRAAIDSFLGDIYSGMQVGRLTKQDRQYAQNHLRILSGLYGIVRPLDGIYPYRLEMGYRISGEGFKNLYDFWGTSIVETLPQDEIIIDLSAVEYGKTITQYLPADRIISPRFLTISPKTGQPTFVVVHAKIARGAFASWMIRGRIDDV